MSEQAQDLNKQGLALYKKWELEGAIEAFHQAVRQDRNNPDYHLNLARAYARQGNYQETMMVLGDYLRVEKDEAVMARYENMFSSAMDEVENQMIPTMKKLGLSLQQIGKAIQMWLEYRISIGRQPLVMDSPELWAGALTYATIKVNFLDIKKVQVADAYKVQSKALREQYLKIVEVLDLMPADFRYFVGETNPLDRLVEAAQILEELDRKFQADE